MTEIQFEDAGAKLQVFGAYVYVVTGQSLARFEVVGDGLSLISNQTLLVPQTSAWELGVQFANSFAITESKNGLTLYLIHLQKLVRFRLDLHAAVLRYDAFSTIACLVCQFSLQANSRYVVLNQQDTLHLVYSTDGLLEWPLATIGDRLRTNLLTDNRLLSVSTQTLYLSQLVVPALSFQTDLQSR